MLIVLVIHGKERQLIMQGRSCHKSISNVRVMAKNILLHQIAK